MIRVHGWCVFERRKESKSGRKYEYQMLVYWFWTPDGVRCCNNRMTRYTRTGKLIGHSKLRYNLPNKSSRFYVSIFVASFTPYLKFRCPCFIIVINIANSHRISNDCPCTTRKRLTGNVNTCFGNVNAKQREFCIHVFAFAWRDLS